MELDWIGLDNIMQSRVSKEKQTIALPRLAKNDSKLLYESNNGVYGADSVANPFPYHTNTRE